jgi:hypothetical protein
VSSQIVEVRCACVSIAATSKTAHKASTDLPIPYNQPPRRRDNSHQARREHLLDKTNIILAALIHKPELRVALVDLEALGGAQDQPRGVLVEGHVVHRHAVGGVDAWAAVGGGEPAVASKDFDGMQTLSMHCGVDGSVGSMYYDYSLINIPPSLVLYI